VGNPWLLGGLLLANGLQFAAIYTAPMNRFFSHSANLAQEFPPQWGCGQPRVVDRGFAKSSSVVIAFLDYACTTTLRMRIHRPIEDES
jgi:hypothetical protein